MDDFKIIERKEKKARGWNLGAGERVWLLNVAIVIFAFFAGLIAIGSGTAFWQRLMCLVIVMGLGWFFAANNGWWRD